jgi:hypothetical protein
VDYPAERHTFPLDNSRKIKTFRGSYCGKACLPRGKSKHSSNYPSESFSIPRKVIISLFKGLALILQIILDKSPTIGHQYYPRFGIKNNIKKTWYIGEQ